MACYSLYGMFSVYMACFRFIWHVFSLYGMFSVLLYIFSLYGIFSIYMACFQFIWHKSGVASGVSAPRGAAPCSINSECYIVIIKWIALQLGKNCTVKIVRLQGTKKS